MLSELRDRVLDATILYSFDRSGFARHARGFDDEDLDVDLSGKVCLVTGANSGIGLAAATELARRSARVRLLCRDSSRGDQARASIVARTGNPDVHVDVLDVSDLGRIRAFDAALREERVDALIHNAGVLPDMRTLTKDGLELCFATHVAGPFLLTQLLATRLGAAGGGRVVFVSSGGMFTQRLSLADLDWKERDYDGVSAYAQTKRQQVVLTELLAERMGGGLRFHSMHPGWADTDAVRTSLPRFWRVMKERLRTAEQAADTVVWLAIAARPGRENGCFWFDRTHQTTHLVPFTVESQADRARLWEICRERIATAALADRRAGGL